MTVGRVRPAVAAMASYRPGKSAAQAEDEHGITDAIKLASNENPYQPVPAIVAAIAAAAGDVNRYGDHRAEVPLIQPGHHVAHDRRCFPQVRLRDDTDRSD